MLSDVTVWSSENWVFVGFSVDSTPKCAQFYYKKVPIKQITSIGKMLKSSFPFCDSDQIAMSSHNVQTSLFIFFRRDATIWVDTINKIQKRNNKLYIMEESSHTWLKYTYRMCKVCLFIRFFARLAKMSNMAKNVTLFFYIIAICITSAS